MAVDNAMRVIGQWLTSICCRWLGVTCTSSTLRPRSAGRAAAAAATCARGGWAASCGCRRRHRPASRPWRRLDGCRSYGACGVMPWWA
ncbi:hypothetical protein FSC37_20270 [Piscinibacter aquaticus]|uniref:Uncharacterized protein n=1 Tax=Piscinibacter aquaticus TaxID=392597 RepID=A0A5C6U2H4_9BURK|nr:hypothetical protein FSC37_20270 [Piscinibacter aquaticus]